MLRSLISHALRSAERHLQLPGSMAYLDAVARVSTSAFLKFTLFLPLAAYRRRAPLDVLAAARLAATLHQDCGTCVQIVLAQARQHGVSPVLLQAVLDGRLQDLPYGVGLATRFAGAVAEQSPEMEELREQVRSHFGEDGLVELALSIASAQVFPITKRALGFAQSCSVVPVRALPDPEHCPA